MFKLVVFDLDGVLISSKDMHYLVLNQALKEFGHDEISYSDHLRRFDGLSTFKKLKMLNIPDAAHKMIWDKKQEYTIKYIKEHVKEDQKLKKIFSSLYDSHYKIVVASNSIREVVKLFLLRLGVMEYVDRYYSNQDVVEHKPNPEMYLRIMADMSVAPKNTLIVEDSFYGLTAAHLSGGRIMQIGKPVDLTLSSIEMRLNMSDDDNGIVWEDENATVLIPMAGDGKRFEQAGYTFPKPLIDVNGKTMISLVVDSLGIKSKYVFVVKKDHYEKYMLNSMLNHTVKGCDIIKIEKTTEGAACTTLLAEKFIDNDKPLIIANSDQFIKWNSVEAMYEFMNGNADALILTFNSNHPQWSYAKVQDEYVTEVAEKKVISNHATVGVYIWKRGSDYVKYAKKMIAKNIRHNNEFYVAPVFNEAIADGLKVKIFDVEMWGLGTPELLERFQREYK